MPGWLTSFLLSPGLFLAGAALVAVPILIHLLNRRRFRTVEWAAMDFLLEAEKLNRRRVRLENLLLLALRCLAVLLVGLLVARPFRPATSSASWLETLQFERIVVLDDSLSMEADAGGKPAFSVALDQLQSFVQGLANDASHNSLTLFIASRPDQPVFNAVHLSEETIALVTQKIKEMTPADVPCDLTQTLLAVEQSLDDSRNEMNQLIYVLTDLRSRDWERDTASGDGPDVAGSPAEVLRRVGERVAGCFLIRFGETSVANLSVERITPLDKALVAGVETRFDVTVANHGSQDVADLEVTFTAGESLPLKKAIDIVPAGSTADVPFQYTFAAPLDGTRLQPPSPVRIEVELQAQRRNETDRLKPDNQRYFAAQLVDGIRTLLVDGDPSGQQGTAETFWLRSALAPVGSRNFGVALDIATDDNLADVVLDDYEVIFLCNLYRVTEEFRERLEAWVRDGGGLVIALGDQIDEQLYHRTFHREGEGLLPVELLERRGQTDASSEDDKWVLFDVQHTEHPLLRVFSGEDNPFRQWVKVFRYWQLELLEDTTNGNGGVATVLARFTDTDASPAIIERIWGEGRVLCLATPLDADWNNWPHDFSYAVAMQELVRHLAQPRATEATKLCGATLNLPLDLTQYRADGVMITAAGETQARPLQPTPPALENDSQPQTVWQLEYDGITRRGFYDLALGTHDEELHHKLFAANVDPTESELLSANPSQLRRDLGEHVHLVEEKGLTELDASAARGDLWKAALALLVVALCGEQSLAWWFGRRR